MPYPNPDDPVSALTRADGDTEAHSTDHGRVIGIWENVKHWGAAGDGVTDDTDAFTSAAEAAGRGGTVFVPSGVFILNEWTPPTQVNIRGAGMPTVVFLESTGTTLKAKAGANWVVKLVASTETLLYPSIGNLMINGNNTAGCVTVNEATAPYAVQGAHFENVCFFRGLTGVKIDGGIINQNDAASFLNCWWKESVNNGLWLNTPNSQQTTIIGGKISGGAVGVRLSGGTLTFIGGQIDSVTRGFLFDSTDVYMLSIINFIDENLDISIDGSDQWPQQGVWAIHSLFAAYDDVVIIGGSGSNVFRADQCQFNNGQIRYVGADSLVMDNNCIFYPGWGGWVDDSGGTGNNRRIGSDINGSHYYFNNFSTAVGHRYVTGEIHGKVATSVKAGTPADGDYYFVANGMMAVDSNTNRLYVRVGGAWKYAALT